MTLVNGHGGHTERQTDTPIRARGESGKDPSLLARTLQISRTIDSSMGKSKVITWGGADYCTPSPVG